MGDFFSQPKSRETRHNSLKLYSMSSRKKVQQRTAGADIVLPPNFFLCGVDERHKNGKVDMLGECVCAAAPTSN